MTIPITIDGQQIEVTPGITVLKAADSAGITIPTLCNHPALKPYGACRLCVVEVEGARTLQASCTLPVFKGMVVRTNTPRVKMAREFVLTLIFSERNHFCMFCQKSNGDCELQNSAYGEGLTHWPIQPNWDPQKVDASSPYFVFDHNRCILCRRCVRTCSELVGNFTLSLENRGASSHIVADAGILIGNSSCVRCGNCVQICPTGTLIDRNSAYIGRDVAVDHVQSICTGCSVGCGVDLLIKDNRLVRIDGAWDAPVNGGILCEQGRYLELNTPGERILYPLIRKNGGFEKASWEEALSLTAENVSSAATEHALSALVSTRLTAEALHLFKSSFSQNGDAASIEENYTSLGDNTILSGSMEDLKQADCVVVFGADLVRNHKVAGFFIKRNIAKGTCLVVIDPYKNQMDDLAHYVLRPAPGTDQQVIEGLTSAIVSLGLNKDTPSTVITPASLANASKTCNINRDILAAAAREIACAQKPVFVLGEGLAKEKSVAVFKALEDLSRIVKGAAILNTRGKANSAAAQKLGLDRSFNPIGSKAVYVALGDDEPSPRLINSLSETPFLVVQASYTSELTEMASVILPVETCFEQEGHYLNLDERLQKSNRALQAPAGVKSNLEVLQMLAHKMNLKINEEWQAELVQR